MSERLRAASRASEHDARVRHAFTRQAGSFAASKTLTAREMVDRSEVALAECAEGRLLEIIADPVRMGALETVLRELARRGADADIGLREEDGDLAFDDRFGTLTGRRPQQP